jgi:hypothetical protein
MSTNTNEEARYRELIAELTQRAAIDREREAEKSKLIDEVNAIRDRRAIEEAKERFGIEPEMYIRARGGQMYRVKSLSIGEVNDHSFDARNGEFDEKGHRDRDNSVEARCWRITAAGKPEMQRGYYNKGKNATETVRLNDRNPVTVVPESEIAAESSRASASEAKRKLAGLSDEQIQAALKAAGIK